MVDLAQRDGPLARSNYQLQDGRVVHVHDDRYGCRDRPLEPTRHPTRIYDGQLSTTSLDLLVLVLTTSMYLQQHVGRHFAARFAGLIVLPSLVYLFWFWVHFAVLIKSGPGDDFMTPAFQETLIGSPLTLNAEGALPTTSACSSEQGFTSFR